MGIEILVICRWCREREEKSLMECREIFYGEPPKIRRNYYHKECYPIYAADAEYKRQEEEAKLKLMLVIADIYEENYKNIPPDFYKNIEQLRNGNPHLKAKNYKNGYTYEFLTEVYLYCNDEIQRVRTYKKDFTSLFNELKYGLAIVRDNIYNVIRLKERQEAQRLTGNIVNTEYELNIAQNEKEVVYKPRNQKRKNDISDFLD